MRKSALILLAGAIGFAWTATTADANPLSGSAAAVQAGVPKPDVVEVRHGRMTCVRGKDGWHYHNARKERIVCPPRPRSAFVSWRCSRLKCGWYHRGQKRFL